MAGNSGDGTDRGGGGRVQAVYVTPATRPVGKLGERPPHVRDEVERAHECVQFWRELRVCRGVRYQRDLDAVRGGLHRFQLRRFEAQRVERLVIEAGQEQFGQLLQFGEQVGELCRVVPALCLLIVQYDVERLLASLREPH